MAAAGRHATMIWPHSLHVPLRSCVDFALENGFSAPKNMTHTARMAPSWMTTRNMSQKSLVTSSVTNWLSRSMCPVLETGSHSVMPSTSPYRAAFRSSTMFKRNLPSRTAGPSRRRARALLGRVDAPLPGAARTKRTLS